LNIFTSNIAKPSEAHWCRWRRNYAVDLLTHDEITAQYLAI